MGINQQLEQLEDQVQELENTDNVDEAIAIYKDIRGQADDIRDKINSVIDSLPQN